MMTMTMMDNDGGDDDVFDHGYDDDDDHDNEVNDDNDKVYDCGGDVYLTGDNDNDKAYLTGKTGERREGRRGGS